MGGTEWETVGMVAAVVAGVTAVIIVKERDEPQAWEVWAQCYRSIEVPRRHHSLDVVTFTTEAATLHSDSSVASHAGQHVPYKGDLRVQSGPSYLRGWFSIVHSQDM